MLITKYRSNRYIQALFVALISLALSCTSKKNNIINNWEKDTCGCLHLRNKELADSLIKANSLMHSAKEDFLTVFGAPDNTENIAAEIVLVY
jgi:hypothetical protein